MTEEGTRTVYIETSVVSYLTARATSNLLAAAWQAATVEWWDTHRSRFELRTSTLTLEEAGRGHLEAAARRLTALGEIAILPITEAVAALSDALIHKKTLPASAQGDAIHIAVSAVHGVDYLLTWNFRHLANAETKPLIRNVCEQQGYVCPEICTPSELMGGREDV